MKNNTAFTILVIAIICSSGLMAVALNVADSSDAATRTNDNWDGAGTESDPYVLYMNNGDSADINFGVATVTSGTLPSGLEWKKSGTDTTGITGTLGIDSPRAYSGITWTVESGTFYLTINACTVVVNKVSGDNLPGYGTQADPWQLHMYEKDTVEINFGSYGTLSNCEGLPDNLTVNGNKVVGTASDSSKGSYTVTMTIDGETYYMEVSVGNIVPTYVMYIFVVVLIVIFLVLVFMWSTKFKFSHKN